MLIDKTEIAIHREISRTLKNDKINPIIEDAELLDLKPLLGEALYNDIVDNPTTAANIKLLDPLTYTYNGTQYKHQGLKKVLSIFVNSRYVLSGSYVDTGFGLVQKNNQDSTPVPEASKRNIHKQDKQTATAYFNEVALYLNRNASDHPLWNSGCNTTSISGIRISKISI